VLCTPGCAGSCALRASEEARAETLTLLGAAQRSSLAFYDNKKQTRTEHRERSTENGAQSTEHRAQSTENGAQKHIKLKDLFL
jgi:hypothetical protein